MLIAEMERRILDRLASSGPAAAQPHLERVSLASFQWPETDFITGRETPPIARDPRSIGNRRE